jgi:hypothetical protein
MHMGHGRSDDVLHHVFFGGRRRRVLTRMAALSGTTEPTSLIVCRATIDQRTTR